MKKVLLGCKSRDGDSIEYMAVDAIAWIAETELEDEPMTTCYMSDGTEFTVFLPILVVLARLRQLGVVVEEI